MTEKVQEIKWSEDKIVGLLQERHAEVEWAVFPLLRDSTGYQNSFGDKKPRTFDFYAMHTWPSKHIKIAYEIKISRNDFIKELEDPSKRKSALSVSNEFYYVTAPGVVKDIGEIPEVCGWFECAKPGAGMRRKKQATYRECEDLPMIFVMSLLRAASADGPTGKIFQYAGRDLDEEEFRKAIEDGRTHHDTYEIDSQVRIKCDRYLKKFREQKIKDERLIRLGQLFEEVFGKNIDRREAAQSINDLCSGHGTYYLDGSIKIMQDAINAVRKFEEWRKKMKKENCDESEIENA